MESNQITLPFFILIIAVSVVIMLGIAIIYWFKRKNKIGNNTIIDTTDIDKSSTEEMCGDIDELKKKILELEELNETLKETIRQFKEPILSLSQLINNFPNFKGMKYQDHSDTLIDYINKYILVLPEMPQDKKESFKEFIRYQNTRCESLDIIIKLRGLMNKFQTDLQNQQPPITTEAARCNLDSMLNIAMICFDNIAPFYSNNKRAEQEINIRLLTDNNYSRDKALNEAKVMTNNLTETPKWIVVMKETLNKNGIVKSNTIFTGYKLNN